ncbi:hypothetical protein V6Z11_D13G140600 [Gossypium hirsutum]
MRNLITPLPQNENIDHKNMCYSFNPRALELLSLLQGTLNKALIDMGDVTPKILAKIDGKKGVKQPDGMQRLLFYSSIHFHKHNYSANDIHMPSSKSHPQENGIMDNRGLKEILQQLSFPLPFSFLNKNRTKLHN